MDIPSYLNTAVVDKNGNLTPAWENIMTQLLNELQLNVSNEGYKLPLLTTDQINNIGIPPDNVQRTLGYMVYDSVTNEFKVYINGVWRVVQVV